MKCASLMHADDPFFAPSSFRFDVRHVDGEKIFHKMITMNEIRRYLTRKLDGDNDKNRRLSGNA